MCDGSDKNQELLEKLSRQLSELTSGGSTHLNEISPPDIGSQWAQSSGLPSEDHLHPHSPSFSPLYTWDPAFLQPSTSSAGSSPHLSNPSFTTQEPTASPSSFPFSTVDHNQSGSISDHNPDPLFASHEFQVLGDLSGRFSNLPKSSQDYNPIGSSHPNFHPNQTPIVGRSFVPAPSHEEFLPNFSSVIGHNSSSLNSNNHNFNLHHSPTASNPLGHRDGLDKIQNISNNNSRDLANQSPYFEPPPSFDPTTPPPPFPFQRQLSDTSGPTVGPPVGTSTEFLDYLRLHSEPPINLDSYTRETTDTDYWKTFPTESENISTSEEGKQLYTEALNKWNSFDFAGIDTSQPIEENFTPAENDIKELLPEPSNEGQGQDSTKPSYSQIAKTPKTATASSPSVEQVGVDSTSKTRFTTKDGKPYRPLIQRTISASKFWPKGSSDGGIDQPKVSPTSRYGLDSFEDSIPSSVGKSSEGLGSTTRTKRRSSSAAVLDDLSSNMTDKAIINEDEDDIPAKDNKSMLNQKTKSNSDTTDAQSKVNTSSSSSAKMQHTTSSASKTEEKLFFDPKRIFQTKNTQKSTAKSNVNEKTHQSGDTVLNNGKPTPSSFKLPTAARQHDYINNDLRDTNKVTNKTAAEGAHTTAFAKNDEAHTKHRESSRSSSGKRSSGGRVNGSYHREKRKMAEDEYADAQNGHRFLPIHFEREKLEKWLGLAFEKMIIWGNFLLMLTRSFLIYALGITLFLSYGAYQLTRYMVFKGWGAIRTKVYARLGKTPSDDNSWKAKESVRRRVGLEEKIILPSTGEEAMKRLLACKGKDPYSILGVRQDSSDEDIKKYYRKQAVLVHPDKNQEPGAEEAFKILGHAFEKIGEPSKRQEYDTQALVESESELRKEFADLITKLQTKIQEAANLMPCDNCGKKHRRIPVDRPFYSARFCQRCNIRHPAKEGDVWAESSVLGFYWNYYALMEGHVYDITEWMKCHHEFYKRMRANEHTVLTRIATDGNKKTKHHHNREANLEDFINRFFPKMPGQAGGGPSQTNGGQPSSGTEPGWGHASGGPSAANRKAAAGGGGGGRRKKKRH